MAKSTIEGLTIEIGANTKNFTSAIKEIQKEARNLSKDLKTVDEHLKIDPNNVQKSADKLKLLQDAAQNAAKKVETISAAIEKFKASRADTMSDDYKNSLAKLERQLESAKREQDLANEKVKQFGKEADDSGKKAISLGDIIKANLISDFIKNGLKSVAELAKNIGTAALNALKDIAKGVVDFTKASLSIAEENRQTLAKVGQVFGDSKQQVVDWSKDAVTSIGLTSGEAQSAAATFGNMFAALDVGIVKTDKIDTNFATMSTDLVQLAADVAAFNNTTTANVLDAFQSGLAGTSRQLREYGIVITAALVEQKALDLGLKQNADDLTESDKIIARYALMMEQAAHQTGQFARESDSATVQQQILTARIRELQGEIGEKLIPVQAKLYELVNNLLGNEAVQELLDRIIGKVGDLAQAFLDLFNGIDTGNLSGSFTDIFTQLMDTLYGLLPSVLQFGADLINSLLEGINTYLPLIVAAATPLITSLFNGIVENLPTIAEGALSIIQTLCDAIVQNIQILAPVALSLISDLARFILDNLPTLFQAAIDLVLEIANGISSALPDLIPAAVEVVLQLAKTLLDNLPEITKAAYDLFLGIATGIINSIPVLVEYLPQLITSLIDVLVAAIPQFIQAGFDLLVAIVANLPMIIEAIIVGVAQIVQSIIDYFTNHWEDIKQVGKDLLSNIWEGIKSMGSWFENNFTEWISGIWSKIKGRLKSDAETEANNWQDDFQMNPPILGGGTWEPQASGGPVRAGRLYRVNDDAGRRTEWFIPSQNGYILNGNQTDRIVNNNNSRSVGNVNIYVNSYGMNVAEVADELGAAFQNKIRMSGAML